MAIIGGGAPGQRGAGGRTRDAAPEERDPLLARDPVAPAAPALTWALDLAQVDEAAVRRLVAAELVSGSRWAQVRSLTAGRYRRISPVEVVLWTDQVVRVTGRIGGDLARARQVGLVDLDQLPFVVVVAPDAVLVRWQAEVADHHDALLLLQRLVAAATAASRSNA